jgi:predicted ATPase
MRSCGFCRGPGVNKEHVWPDWLRKILSRHLDYFRSLARSAYGALLGADQKAWLGRLRREHDNLRAALAWSAAEPDRMMAALEYPCMNQNQ